MHALIRFNPFNESINQDITHQSNTPQETFSLMLSMTKKMDRNPSFDII